MIDPIEVMIWRASYSIEARKVAGRRLSVAKSLAIERWAHSMALIAEQHFGHDEDDREWQDA